MTRVSRRRFLRVTATGTGALALGFVLPGCGGPRISPEVARHAERTGDFQPNAWIRITPASVVVFHLDRVEMGQGTMTSHTTLIAEELEVDPASVQVELAPARRSFDNPDPELGFQVTGGSTSTATSWMPLRRAAATAREMLRSAAARRWDVPASECRVRDGRVTHDASGRGVRYGQLVREAAWQPVPEHVPLKPRSEWRHIGRPVPRLDAPAKVDGSAEFGIDVKLPGLLTAVVVRSPVLGGRLRSFDVDAARGMPGVVSAFPISSGVAVVARTYWEARKAAERVEVQWDEGRLASLNGEGVRRGFRERVAHPGLVVREEGDALERIGRADRTVEARYELPYLQHAPLEPMNATAHVTETRCDVWAPTQSPALARELAVHRSGLPHRHVHIHQALLGGGFGRRLEQEYVGEAVEVARRTRAPVKVIWSREDDFATGHFRPMAYSVMRAALDPEGRPAAWFHRLATPSIVSHVGPRWVGALVPNGVPGALKRALGRSAAPAYRHGYVLDETAVEGAHDLPYAFPEVRVEWAEHDPGIPIGFWRAVGHSHTAFAVESFLDEVAHAADRDPFALRKTLLADAPRSRRVLETVAEKAGWGEPLPQGVGRGIAFAESFRSRCAQVAEVAVENGVPRVRRVVCAIDCGTVVNPDLVVAQMESGIVYGASAALYQTLDFEGGRVQQTNYHQYPLVRMHDCPRIEVHIVESEEAPTGVGEPGLPPIAPAIANALFAATGVRVRRLPIVPQYAEARG